MSGSLPNSLLRLSFLGSMFSVQMFLACLCAIQFCVFGRALFVQKPSLPSITQAQDLSRQNASMTLSSPGCTTFPIPDSSLTLVLQRGRGLDPISLQAVLVIAGAFVADKITDCNLVPLGHDLAGGVELDIWPSVSFLTWAQLRTVIRGLQLFQVEGKRFYSYHFEIRDSEKLDIHSRIGWGNTGKPSGFVKTQLRGTWPSSISSPIAERAVDLGPATPDRKIFRIPGSQLVLVLRRRAAVQPDSAEAILLTSDAWVARKISKFGENSPVDFIFDYGTGDKPYTRLIVWSSMARNLTWGQLKTVIDGLWIVLVDQLGYGYTFFEIHDHKVNVKSQLGWGAIVETDRPARKPLLEITPLISTLNSTSANSLSTSKRALQISSAQGLPALNVSYPITTVAFQIPASDMKLVIQNLTNPPHDCSTRALIKLVVYAAIEFDADTYKFGKDTPSSGQEYVSTMPGIELRLLKVFRPPLGYLTYDQLRTMMLGLQLYMVIGKRPQAIGFKVLYGDDDVTLGHGSIAARRAPDVELSGAADS